MELIAGYKKGFLSFFRSSVERSSFSQLEIDVEFDITSHNPVLMLQTCSMGVNGAKLLER